MTIPVLTSMISAFCVSHVHPVFDFRSKEDRIECIEKIVNCAIVSDGKVRKDFEVCFKK